MPSAYSPEGYLKKNPLLGSIYSSSAGNAVLSKVSGSFGKLYEQALQAGALGRSTYVQTFQPGFQSFKASVQPDYTEAVFKGEQQAQRADLIRGRVSQWYHKAFPGRSDFQRMLAVQANQNEAASKPHFERANILERKVTQKAKPLNEFFGGGYFDSSLSKPILEPYWYEVGGRDWKKRFVRGGSKIVGETRSGSQYPGAPKESGLF